jgi:hypothetical protein
VVAVLLNVDVDLFLCALLLLLRRKAGCERRLVTVPSGGALLRSWKLDLTLDVSFFDLGRCGGDVSIRRREDAEGDRNTGVKVQIAGSLAREITSRMPSE